MGIREKTAIRIAKKMGIDTNNPRNALKKAVTMACKPAVQCGVVTKKELETIFNEILNDL